MGCGSSKFRPEGDDQLVAPRIRPVHLLRRKRKNNGITMSKKVLLKDDRSELLEVEESSSMLVVVVDTHNNNKKKKKKKNRIKTTMSMSSSSYSDDDDDDIDIDIDDSLIPLEAHELKHNHTDPDLELNIHENNKLAEEEGTPDNQDNPCFICPGSPSFRVYFVEETQNDNKDNVEMKDAGVEDVSHNKSPSHDSVESTTSAKFGKGKEKKIIKKGEKGKSFNRVISKKKSVGVGVKNLLNVKSCYHLSCSGNDSRTNLLARKA